MVPRGVLWGFFIFMAVEGLPGSQFYNRLRLFFVDPHKLKFVLFCSTPVYDECIQSCVAARSSTR